MRRLIQSFGLLVLFFYADFASGDGDGDGKTVNGPYGVAS